MREGETITLGASRLPADVAVGQEFRIELRGRVRRIEAEHVNVSAYDAAGAVAMLEGNVEVELTVLRVATDRYVNRTEETS